MELQTVRQVSQNYGISARMLRYYEQAGLIESSRVDGYVYRVYNQSALKRLQQIIILRKLQISIKQIRDILNNQDAVEVVEIFKQNINELDEKITALSTIKLILSRFVGELQEKADVHLKLDVLNYKSMISLVDSLSIPISRVEEKLTVERLIKANETLNKYAHGKVKVVYIPNMMVVGGTCKQVKKFIDDVDLFKLKPDARIFGANSDEQNHKGLWSDNFNMWVSIPDNLDIPACLNKWEFYGGLYASCTSYPGDYESGHLFREWFDNNENYASNNGGNNGPYGINRPTYSEYFNAFNRYELNDSYSEEIGFTYFDYLEPIKEISKPASLPSSKIITMKGLETIMEVKDALKSNLKGEALTRALDFVDYLVEKGLTPRKEWSSGFRFIKNDKSPCLIVLTHNKDGWFICDMPVVHEPEWANLDDELKAFLLDHIKICNVHLGNKCGCGSEPGLTKSIFGKLYNNVCTSEVQLINPSTDVLEKFKEIIEWWVVNVGK